MRFKSIIIFTCLIGILCASPFLSTTPAQAKEQPSISMDFKNVDIRVLIKFISELTNKNFIVDRRVGGRVTIYSPTKVTVTEAYKVFESILTVNNFTIVPSGSAYKILPLAEGRLQNTQTRDGKWIDKKIQDQMVTQIVSLKHSSATELVKILSKTIANNGIISAYPPNNTVIITAPYNIIKKALSLIQRIDKSKFAPKTITVKLEYGDAKSIAANVTQIMDARIKEQEKQGQNTIAVIRADERTNTVIALADDENGKTILQIIKKLDIPTPKGKGDINLIPLSNAKAEDVAKVLNSLVERQGQTKEQVVLSRDVKIVADKATNSIVITARPDDFNTLRGIIKKMDVMRRQVFIEALIMEVNSDATFSFGVNWTAGAGGNVFGFGGVSLNGSGMTFSKPSDGGGTASLPAGGSIGAMISNAFKIGDTQYSIQSVVNAIKNDNAYKILATPQLLTLDNEEASVNVVDNVPFTKESTTSNTNQDYNSQSIDYKDVGVKLKITPHINDDDMLRLEIEQEVSRVTQGSVSDGGLLAPTTRKREVKTTILLQDGRTAVIAGLLSEDDTHNQAKVPGLGDIPGLGWLFKSKKEVNTQTNLLIFLTPRVINSFDETDKITAEKKRRMHNVIISNDGLALPITSAPMLPETILIK
ncbi:MAG: type II secretion system secretin GspD [Desulfovibrio sp.]